MVIRSIQQPAYNRQKDSGLPGQGPKRGFSQDNSGKSFEDYLLEAFQGEVVQKGAWVSPQVSEMGQRNLKRLG